MNIRIVKIILIVFTLFVMGFIFYMSAMNADDSTELSTSVGYTVGEIVVPNFDQLPVEEQTAFALKIQHPLRKLAHFTEFAALGFLFLLDVRIFFGLEGFKSFIVSIASGLLYAGSDELHQRLISGRSGELLDVMIDCSGVVFGTLICALCILLFGGLFARMIRADKI